MVYLDLTWLNPMKSQSILVECHFLLLKSDWTTFLLANLMFSWWTHLFFSLLWGVLLFHPPFFSKDQTSSGAAGTSMSLTTTCRVAWHMVCGHPYHGNPTHNPVGGIPTPLKNMKVSWDPNWMDKNKFQTTSQEWGISKWTWNTWTYLGK